MKKRLILLCSIALLGLAVIGCGNDSAATPDDSCISVNGNGLFVLITEDRSNVLTVDGNSDYHHYYYLRDTRIVYVGYISEAGISRTESVTPVISENGNYYHYDVKKQQAVEVN